MPRLATVMPKTRRQQRSRERMGRFNNDPSSPAFLWISSFRAVAIGWTLHMQGRGWLESGWYREIRGSPRFLLDFGHDDRRR